MVIFRFNCMARARFTYMLGANIFRLAAFLLITATTNHLLLRDSKAETVFRHYPANTGNPILDNYPDIRSWEDITDDSYLRQVCAFGICCEIRVEATYPDENQSCVQSCWFDGQPSSATITQEPCSGILL